MAKKRIYDLAKELNVDSKEILNLLSGDLTSSSGIEEADEARVRKHFSAAQKTDDTKKSEGSSEAPKKKKPVLLFRPENSSFGGKKPEQKKSSQGQNQNRNSNTGNGSRSQNDRRSNTGRTEDPMRRTIIKPSVPTTAEMYRDYTKPEKVKAEEPKKEVKVQEAPVTEAPVKEPVNVSETVKTEAPVKEPVKAEAPKEVKAEPVVKETVKAETPVKSEAPASEPVKAEAPKEPVKAETVKAETKTETKENVSDTAEKRDRRDPSQRPSNVPTRTASAPVRQPMERGPRQQNGDPTDPRRHKVFVDNRGRNGQDRGYQGQNRDGQERTYQNRDGQERSYQNRDGQDRGYQGQNRDGQSRGYQGQNRDGQSRGYQGQNRDGQNRGYQGQNRDGQNRRPFNGQPGQNRDGQNRSFGDKGDNQGRAPFNRNGQGNGQGRPFGNRPAGGASAASGAGSGTLSKSDVRGKKGTGTTQHEKSRQDRDRTGRKEENFKNLSKGQNTKKPVEKKVEEQIKMIVIPEVITIKDLADKMKQKPGDLIKKLFLQGKMMTLNSELSYEEAEEIAMEYDILCEQEVQVDVIEELLREEDEDEALMVERPPVVCVMGHVDHGKTSLLDRIRETNVTAREAGGITQHIGAYMVDYNGKKITFLDTPGHEAFTAMRMRGAQATDIAILVVAADDGVMPQTIEAINHAKAAGVEIIVAVNKIDKPGANVERVKQELMEYELVAEEWGGQTIFVPVSAKTGENIDELLENILLVTEVQELKANPNREMRGIVIEAKLDKGRGPVATVLVQKGTLKQAQFVSAGSCYGRVRAMLDATGTQMKQALPATPVEILGLNGVPNAGEVCIGHKNEKEAREYAETFIAEQKKKMLAETKANLTMDSLFKEIQAGNIKELPLIVKADVQGSVEAVKQSLEKLTNEEVAVKVIHAAVGAINESDISLATASNAIVIGFNIKADPQAKAMAEQENIDMRLYRVIYQAIEDIENAMKGMLAPVYEEKVLGHAEVRQTFKASGVGTIAGSYVTDGTFERGCMIRVYRTPEGSRNKDLIFEGNMASLKRFKDDVKEVREGYECGIVCEKFNDLMEGDTIEAYKMVQVERK